MKFILNKDKLTTVELDKNVNSGAINYYNAEVNYDESWDGLVIEAILIERGKEKGTSIAVINKQLSLNISMSQYYSIGFVGYKIEDNKKTYQISTNLESLYIQKGAGEVNTVEHILPELTEWEIYIAQIQEIIKGVQSIPAGGLQGQVLTKKSDRDYEYEWKDQTGGGGGIGTESDPTVPSHVKNIKEQDITNWNNKASISDVTEYIEEHKDELKGDKGDTGDKGDKGDTGEKGADGYTPRKNIDYFDGKDGVNGEDGKDGYTPVKYKDYYTEEDKQEMVNLVLGALPNSEEVSY